MILSGLAIVLVSCKQRLAEVWAISLFSAFAVALTIYAAVIQSAGLAYDMRPIAARLKVLQDQGVPLAHAGKYPGQYQFVGRMVREPEVVSQDQLAGWFNAHPNGKAVVYFSSRQSLAGLKPDYQQPYLGDNVVILGRESWPPAFTTAETSDVE